MTKISESYQTSDWKTEKHVPVIELPSTIKAAEDFEVKVSVGKEIAHPNTTEHHIVWIALYFKPNDDKFAYNLGKSDFLAHGATVKGPNTITLHTEPSAHFKIKLEKSGTLMAASYCNIHGLWESSTELSL